MPIGKVDLQMTNSTYESTKNKIKYLSCVFPLSIIDISSVEQKLNIKFSNGFKEIANICSYEFIGNFDFYNFGLDSPHSVIFETLHLRQNSNLPKPYIILYQNASAAIFLKCLDNREIIYYIALEDIQNLIDEKALEYELQVFPSFVDFFVYLLKQEESERKNS